MYKLKKKFKNHTLSEDELSSDDEEQVSLNVVGKLYNNTYIALKYIGKGTFSRVWLVYSVYDYEYYAMKIYSSIHISEANQECKILNIVGNHSHYLIKCFDYFISQDNKEINTCYIFQLLGPDVLSLLLKYKDGLPISYVKKITKSALLGLKYLHEKEIIHTDLKIENILQTEYSSEVKEYIQWFEKVNPKKILTSYLDIKIPKNCSKEVRKNLRRKEKHASFKELLRIVRNKFEESTFYLKPSGEEDTFKNNTFINNTCENEFKICDFGSCTQKKKIAKDIQTRQYRSPEVIIRAGFTTSCDIWSLGCIIYELITGYYLFDPEICKKHINRDRKHIALITEVLGDIPINLSKESKKKIFNKKGKLLKYRNRIEPKSFKKLLSVRKDLSEINIALISDLLTQMLDYNWRERISATECLKHPWLK